MGGGPWGGRDTQDRGKTENSEVKRHDPRDVFGKEKVVHRVWEAADGEAKEETEASKAILKKSCTCLITGSGAIFSLSF